MGDFEKKELEPFYKNLQKRFPELQRLSVWAEWDWSNDGVEHSVVMSEVAREMMRWAGNNEWQKVTELLKEIETGFVEGSDKLIAYLGTDFTVTITGCENQQDREQIKKVMGKLTYNAYQINLRGYREA